MKYILLMDDKWKIQNKKISPKYRENIKQFYRPMFKIICVVNLSAKKHMLQKPETRRQTKGNSQQDIWISAVERWVENKFGEQI